MTDPRTGAGPGAEPVVPEPEEEGVPLPPPPGEREQSTTVGTGSYVALSCTVMALVVTFVVLGILFLVRWLS